MEQHYFTFCELQRKRIKKKVNVFGTGEIYRQILPLLERKKIKVLSAVDDKCQLHPEQIYYQNKTEFLFCVGYKKLKQRLNRFYELQQKGVPFACFMAENSCISKNTMLGNGTIINQGAIIDNYVSIGQACFINIGAMISHDTIIKDGVFIAPGANITGFVTINKEVFIGANATIINNLTIGEGALIAAGSVVINDVPANTMVAGNPAKVKKIKIVEKKSC